MKNQPLRQRTYPDVTRFLVPPHEEAELLELELLEEVRRAGARAGAQWCRPDPVHALEHLIGP